MDGKVLNIELKLSSWFIFFSNSRQLRTNTVSFACLRGLAECIDTAKMHYNNWMLDENNNS